MTNPADISPTSPAKPAKNPLWRRLLKWTLRAIVILIVLAIAAWAITDYWAADKIHTEIAKIRPAKEPLTFADLAAMYPPVDPDKDAAPFYAAAAALVRPIDYNSPDADSYYNAFRKQDIAPSPDLLAKAHADLEKNRLALDMLDRGSALPECNYDLQMQYGIAVALMRQGSMRDVGSAASLRTRLCAFEQKGDEAAASLASSLGLLRVFNRQPVTIETMVQWAVAGLCLKDAAVVLERSHPSDASLRALDAAFTNAHLIKPREMLIGERVYFLELTMGRSPEWQTDPNQSPLPESNYWTSLGVIGRVMKANSIAHEAQFIAAAGNDWPTALAAADAGAAQPASALDPTSLVTSAFQRALTIGAGTASMFDATRVAIQIERYRLAHAGALPDSLDKLPGSASLPNDPLTNKPLLYAKTPDGYCVYGAGHNPPAARDADPIKWSEKWGIHIRIPAP